jgi:transcriptional activator HAC1
MLKIESAMGITANNHASRKRAKTEDEKEQRRVERVLRNRRAAQSSRERKRQEVEALEKRNKELEHRLEEMERDKLTLMAQLHRMRRDTGLAHRSSPSSHDPFSGGNVMFFPGLFDSSDSQASVGSKANSLMGEMQLSAPVSPTVDPKSLSPELPSVQLNVTPDASDSGAIGPTSTSKTVSTDAVATAVTAAPPAKPSNSDLTQRPAAMLCDLQCHQSEATGSAAPLISRPSFPFHWMLALLFQVATMQALVCGTLSILNRPLTKISTSLKTGSPIVPTPAILTTTIWLLTHRWTMESSSTNSRQARRRMHRQRSLVQLTSPSPRYSQQSARQRTLTASSTSLRTWLLQQLLSCSPTLARPLEVATMAALRLVVSDRVGSQAVERPWRVLFERLLQARGGLGVGSQYSDDGLTDPTVALPLFVLNAGNLPSKESLITLLWVLRHHRQQSKGGSRGQDLHVEVQGKTGCMMLRSGGGFGCGVAPTGSE